MSSVKCQWVSLQLSKPPSEYLLEHEKNEIDAHLEACSYCRENAELARRMNQVAHLEPPPQSPFADKKIIDAALEGRMPNQPTVQFFPYGRATKLAFGLAAIGAVAIALFLFTTPTDPTTSGVTVKTASSSKAATSAVSQSNKEYNLFTFRDTQPLTLVRQDKVWGTESTIVNLELLSTKLTKVDLVQGKIVAHVTKRKSGEKFVVTSPRGKVEVVGTVFSVEVDDNGVEHVRVLEGTVRVTDKQTGVVHMVTAMQELTLGAAGPTAATAAQIEADRALMTEREEPVVAEAEKPASAARPTSSNSATLAKKAIDEKRLSDATRHIENAKRTKDAPSVPSLLARLARAYRQQKNYTAAESTYKRLINEYGRSDAAKNSLVALAQLDLNVLQQPQEALNWFNSYLASSPNGYLAEEAWIGRARSLRSLGRQNELLETTNSYLSSASRNTFKAEMLLYRANIQLQNGKCDLAETDYKAIIATWPDSKKAKQAQQGLNQCNSGR